MNVDSPDDLEEPVEDCMLCDAPNPPGHVIVRNERGARVGRLCSTHNLAEVILEPTDRFSVEVTLVDLSS